jgi:hypothetical protein
MTPVAGVPLKVTPVESMNPVPVIVTRCSPP